MLTHRLSARLLGMLAAATLAACAQPGPKPLYLWETFPRQQYETLLKEGMNPGDQIRAIEAHAEKARASNATLPPGLRAHLGMLYLTTGNADQARRLWQEEKSAFPESAPYMDQLLRRLDAPANPQRKDSPA